MSFTTFHLCYNKAKLMMHNSNTIVRNVVRSYLRLLPLFLVSVIVMLFLISLYWHSYIPFLQCPVLVKTLTINEVGHILYGLNVKLLSKLSQFCEVLLNRQYPKWFPGGCFIVMVLDALP